MAAIYIAAISVGAMMFNLIYWNFSFLNVGTGGLTAQSFGAGDDKECSDILSRGLCLSILFSILIISAQWPFAKLALALIDAGNEVEAFAAQYFFIRIWAAPATLSLRTFNGWFAGMQDSVSSMWKDIIVNGVNVAASIILALGFGEWEGLGFTGIAWGTVIAQYCGLIFCIILCAVKYRKVLSNTRLSEVVSLMRGPEMKPFMKMNADLMIRSLCFIGIYVGYTILAAQFGDLMLACSSIMMQLLMLFSYFTDGFAYAGEALTGRFIGERNSRSLKKSIKYVFIWSMTIAVLFIGIYRIGGTPLLHILTDNEEVILACRKFLPWLAIMPPLGCAAFTWDGIFIGATRSKTIRNSMVYAILAFFISWYAGFYTIHPAKEAGIHLLLGAYFIHLTVRTVYLSARSREVSVPD